MGLEVAGSVSVESEQSQYLSVALREVIESIEGDRAPSTVRSYRLSADNLVRVVGDVRLSQINSRHADQFKSARLKSVRQVSVNVDLRSLRAMFSVLVRWGYVEGNPFAGVKMVKIPEQRIPSLTKEEVGTLLSSIKQPPIKQVVLFAYLTGARLGEIVALRWDAVDLLNRRVTIRSTDTFTTKSRRMRVLPINDILWDELQLMTAQRNQSGYVFVDKNNRPFNESHISHTFKKYCRQLGVDEGIHFHCLRHTFATHLIEAGTPLYDVSKLLGHAHITTTERYAHLLPQDRGHIVNILRV